MSRNAESRFSQVPRVDIQRSRFQRDSRLLTTMNAGSLIPIYVDPVLPGDTFTMDTASLIRMSTPIFPVMDNCFMDIYYFFVPSRLVWDHWREFMGENRETYWTQPTEYELPSVGNPIVGGWNKGSVADYMGIPIGARGITVDALPFRSYALIWNEFFRDQNYMEPALYPTGDGLDIGNVYNPDDRWDGIETACYGGSPLPVSKVRDYFTSCLPQPQKGSPVQIPVFSGDSLIPVGTSNTTHDYGNQPMRLNYSQPPQDMLLTVLGNGAFGAVTSNMQLTNAAVSGNGRPLNLWAYPGGSVMGTIAELRQAFQVQKLLERDAVGGTRYIEILNAHFGVTSPDGRLQRPEYLGGKRIPINIDQVLQTSATNDVSPQGNTAAFSLTTDVSSSFTKSFTEHGYVIGVACIRTDHTYQQGLERFWSRANRFDFYWPALAHISEQPVLRKEVFATVDQSDNNAVFGYQEAWADYRYKPSHVTGAFRSGTGSLDVWHYADYFGSPEDSNLFIADRDFMAETKVNIDRTLAVSSDVEDQFLCDFYFKCTCVRPMPLFSVPGLADHF